MIALNLHDLLLSQSVSDIRKKFKKKLLLYHKAPDKLLGQLGIYTTLLSSIAKRIAYFYFF